MNIALLTDSPFISTGYRNQAIQLCKYFEDKGHKIFWLANGHMGKTIDYARLEDGTEVKAKVIGRLNHQYFADLLQGGFLKQNKIDVLFVILDTFMLHGDPKNPTNGWFLKIDTSPAKVCFWYPSDGGGGMPMGCDLILRKCEMPIAYSKFAQKQVKDYYGLDTDYIPLGTDTKHFHRYNDEKRNLLRKQWGLNDKYVVGVVARNQPRKFLDRTIKAFRKVADKIPEAVLLMHTDPNDGAAPISLPHLIKRYNLENRIRFTGMNAMNSFHEQQMVDVYNLMDCFFLSTSGEGWGIPLVEAMACEVPVVATDYTTTREIVIDNKAGYGINLAGLDELNILGGNMKDYDIEVSNGTMCGSWEVDRGLCDLNDAALKICKIHENPELAKEMGKNGRKAAVEKYDMMEVVAPAFNKLFEEKNASSTN